MNKKIDIELALSRNFNKVSLSFKDESIEYDSEEEMKAKIRQKFKILRDEVNLEFTKIQ